MLGGITILIENKAFKIGKNGKHFSNENISTNYGSTLLKKLLDILFELKMNELQYIAAPGLDIISLTFLNKFRISTVETFFLKKRKAKTLTNYGN